MLEMNIKYNIHNSVFYRLGVIFRNSASFGLPLLAGGRYFRNLIRKAKINVIFG